ncbi:TadB-like protein involved in pilus formation and/or protein secretion [Vibrio coralliirubri]|uniref:type II secretion system F family protein n=1 Tax=Vibrio coralliirubri TaxID=1516159 RepID=UPI000635A214|nr:type II secretion system F family protein [Vibrio coralliirubri]CDU08547.1 TadB-like protein involved in pilus formation and/or protein secretion [Vibrio coralliirubri]
MILVLTVFVLLVAVALFRLNSKQAIVNKRLLLVSGGQRSLSADVSIKKTNHQRNNKLHAFFLRVNALLPVWDKYFIALSAVGFPVAGHMLFPQLAMHHQLLAAVGLWFVCACFLVMYRRKEQVEEFEQGIINVLGLISRAVAAGLSVPQAIEQVSETQPGLLGREFSYIRDNLALGLSLRQSLNDACVRLPYSSFRYFSVALILNQSNGGQLRDILQSLSRTMHDNRAMRKKVKSLTSEPRMTALFLSLLPIGLLAAIAVMEPTMIDRLVNTKSGQDVLVYALCSVCLGTLVLNSLTRNKRFSS